MGHEVGSGGQRIDKAIDAVVAATPTPTPAAQITPNAFDSLDNEKPAFTRLVAHELRLAALFQRTLSRLQSIRDKKLRNETKFARNYLSFAA